MTLTAPLQPEPVICRCGHLYEDHGSTLLGCMANADLDHDGRPSFPCQCGGFEHPEPVCRCGSPLSAHGEAGCTEVVGRDSDGERGRNVYCDCDGFRGAM